MADRAVTNRRTFGRKIAEMDRDIHKLYAKINAKERVESIQAGGFGIGSAPPTDDRSNLLSKLGDSMTGVLAFEPKGPVTINTTGTIDIGVETDEYGSRVIVAPNSGSTDNLVSILNPAFPGQLLFLQGVQTDTITIWQAADATAWATSTSYSIGDIRSNGGNVYACSAAHTSGASNEPGVGANWEDNWVLGNIETLDGSNYDLEDDDIIILQYDTTDAKWQQITPGKQGSAVTQIIDDDTSVSCLDSLPEIRHRLDGILSITLKQDGSGDEVLFFDEAYLDLNGKTFAGVDVVNPNNDQIRPLDETVIHAFTGYMGFSVLSTKPSTLGNAANVGVMCIPYKADNDDNPSSSTLNDWFGDTDGCIGVQFDDDTPDVYTLWVRANSSWKKVVLT